MKTKNLPTPLIITTICLLVWGFPVFAEEQSVSNEDQNSDALDNDVFWTASRLKNAVPIDLPIATHTKTPPKSKVMEARGSRVVFQGHAPRYQLQPEDNRLFERSDNETRANKALPFVFERSQGLSKAFFSSSRVVPAPASQNYYPYSATGKLFFSDAAGQTYICSGTVIQPRLIITAGHCVYDAVTKTWNKNFRFVPGYHKGNAPYGSWDWSRAVTTDAWINSKGRVPNKGDFALIEAKDDIYGRKVGNVVGWHGFFTYSANPNHLTMLGYPANFDGGEWMHRVDSQYFRKSSAITNSVEYGSDMRGGSSGGPWIENFGEESEGQTLNPSGSNYVVAVTSYGPIDKRDYQGASILDRQFSNTSKTGIFDKACANKAGNCN